MSKAVPFQTIQFSISTQFKCKYSLSKTFLFQSIPLSQTVLIQTIQSSISIVFVHKQLNVKTVLFQTIQFCISKYFNSIWPIDRLPPGANTPGQSEHGSYDNEGVLCIPQSSCITETSPSDCLVSYTGHSLGGGLPLCRGAVCVFYSLPSRLGKQMIWNLQKNVWCVWRRCFIKKSCLQMS